jgi:hypothetical protein
LVSRVVDGYHATIFAYGQTGSGKTFTMEGYDYKNKNDGRAKSKAPVIKDNENIGITQRAVKELFQQIRHKKEKHGKHISVFVSFLQIYSEKVFDLLNPSNLNAKKDSKGLRIRWNKKDQFMVENLFIFEWATEDEVLDLFHFGIKNKIVASHNLNHASSRSHAIFTVTCEWVDPGNVDNVIVSKLQLVDLAGSERISLTGTKGIAAKESIDINKSLFVLRKVIMGLSDASRGHSKDKSHIPYRDSKLTSLLKQSIGGNSYWLMIACIAPLDRFFEENISTLNYATRASYIANAPTKNIDPKIREIQELKLKNKALQLELLNANKHIEFLTSLTSEKLQTFGDNLVTDKVKDLDEDFPVEEMSSPIKSKGKMNSKSIPTVPKVSKTMSIGTNVAMTSNQNHLFATGISQPNKSPLPLKNSARQRSTDPFLSVEKRESIEDIAQRRQFEEKMKLITSEIANLSKSRKADSTRFSDAMNRVTDLLKVNQMLRDESGMKEEIIRKKNIENFELKQENEDLRDRIELMETIVQSDKDTFDKYVSSHLLDEAQRNQMGEYIGSQEGCVQIDSVYVELIELRKIVRKLEKRNKHLERQNMENQYQMHFIGNNEPSRPIMKNNGIFNWGN